MRLSGVREGDIVRVNDGLTYFALVRARRGRRLLVDPLGGSWHPAPVRATDVIGHWRRVGPRQKPTMSEAHVQDTPSAGSSGRSQDTGRRLMTAEEVAEILSMTPAWVYEQSRAGRIPTVTLGRYRRYRLESVLAWVEQLEGNGSASPPEGAKRR